MARLKPHPLMAAIVDNPDADLLRLVYADWLDEQGDPKLSMLAETVRIGVELAAVPTGTAQADELMARWKELIRLDWEALRPPMPKWALRALRFWRGLPSELDCTMRRFAEGGARVLDFVPITTVVLGNTKDPQADAWYAARAFARPEMIRIRTLHTLVPLDTHALDVFSINPNVGNLRQLTLGCLLGLTDEGAEALLATAPRLDGLARLDLHALNVSPRVREILRAGFGDRLWINGDRQS